MALMNALPSRPITVEMGTRLSMICLSLVAVRELLVSDDRRRRAGHAPRCEVDPRGDGHVEDSGLRICERCADAGGQQGDLEHAQPKVGCRERHSQVEGLGPDARQRRDIERGVRQRDQLGLGRSMVLQGERQPAVEERGHPRRQAREVDLVPDVRVRGWRHGRGRARHRRRCARGCHPARRCGRGSRGGRGAHRPP